MENSSKNKNLNTPVIIFIVGLLIGFSIGFLVFADKNRVAGIPGNDLSGNQELNDADKRQSFSDDFLLSVNDQLPGETVIVDKVTLAQPSWLVVYTDLKGAPEAILGAQYFDAGNYENLTVHIFVGTVADNTYHVLIHADDGKIFESEFGRHPFDPTKDLPIKGPTGKVISDSFVTISQGARGI